VGSVRDENQSPGSTGPVFALRGVPQAMKTIPSPMPIAFTRTEGFCEFSDVCFIFDLLYAFLSGGAKQKTPLSFCSE
jgi:hypothetical protein